MSLLEGTVNVLLELVMLVVVVWFKVEFVVSVVELVVKVLLPVFVLLDVL